MKIDHRILITLEAPDDPEAPAGTLTGYASIYGNTFMGQTGPQMIAKGSFAESLAANGGVIPIFYQHGWAKEGANSVPIGVANVSENSKGLKVDSAQLFIDTLPEAAAIYLAAKAGALKEWSVGYLATDTTLLHPKTGNELTADEAVMLQAQGLQPVERTNKGELLESSVVVKGANPKTTLVAHEAVPSGDDPQAPGALSDEDEQVIRDTIQALLGQLLAGEVAEFQAGVGGLNPISAIICLLRDLGWYEEIDDADDNGYPQQGTYYAAHMPELQLMTAKPATPATAEEVDQNERAWALLASPHTRQLVRELAAGK